MSTKYFIEHYCFKESSDVTFYSSDFGIYLGKTTAEDGDSHRFLFTCCLCKKTIDQKDCFANEKYILVHVTVIDERKKDKSDYSNKKKEISGGNCYNEENVPWFISI